MAAIAYYRFEGPHDILGNVVDTSGRAGFHGAILMGAPTFNRNVSMASVPRTSNPNRSSMRFGPRDVVRFTYPFPFQTHPEATLELWVHPAKNVDASFIWTTTKYNSGDRNRFNFGCRDGGKPFIEYREPDGTLHPVSADTTVVVSPGEWSYLAFVKRGNEYSIYVNNSSTGKQTVRVSQIKDGDLTDPPGRKPSLPTSTGWAINGRIIMEPRDGFQFAGLIDEIRLSDAALNPPDFLISSPPS